MMDRNSGLHAASAVPEQMKPVRPAFLQQGIGIRE
jgi:hypothetical protein